MLWPIPGNIIYRRVLVASPAKAKTINKYLGSDYTVVASFGHIRDLPPKDGSVRPDEDFAMDWELSERASKPVNEILKLATVHVRQTSENTVNVVANPPIAVQVAC